MKVKTPLVYIVIFMILSRVYVLLLIQFLSHYPETLSQIQNDSIHHYYGGLVSLAAGLFLKTGLFKNILVFGGIGVILEEGMIILEQIGLIQQHMYLSLIDYTIFAGIIISLLLYIKTKESRLPLT
jgi:hypothetical protein